MWMSRLLVIGALLGSSSPALAQPVGRDLSLPQLLVESVEVPVPSSLKVSISGDRANGTYAVGEAIHFSVRANKAAYFEVVAIGPTGNAVQIYPNAFQPAELIAAETVLDIPGPDNRAEILATAPAGLEFIRVIASTTPFPELPDEGRTASGPFEVILGGAEVVARDLQQRVFESDEIAIGDTYVTTVLDPLVVGDLSIPIPNDVLPPPQPPLLAVDKREFQIGERLQIAVTSFEPCYLWVVNVSADGSARLLLPNRLVRDNHVQAGGTVIVSGGSSAVDVVAAGPAGHETIHALCSHDAAPPWHAGLDFSEMFPSLGTDSGVSRALLAEPSHDASDFAAPYGWSRTVVVVTDKAD